MTSEIKEYLLQPLSIVKRSLLPIAGIGISISYYKAIALHTNLIYASESLKNSMREEQNGYDYNFAPLFYRTMHLQNAIINYNNCIDYIYQVLYFYMDIDCIVEMTCSSSEIDTISKKNGVEKYKSFNRKYIQCAVNEKLNSLYYSLMKIDDVSNNLKKKANIIKHQANFWINGNHINVIGIISKNRNDKSINLSDIVTPPLLNIDNEITEIINLHNNFIKFEQELHEILSYNKLIEDFFKDYGMTLG